MSHVQTAVTGRGTWIDLGFTEHGGLGSACDLHQLRHHTKNVLQQILLRIEQAHDLKATAHGSRLLADLQRRILLSAQISDALFGLTDAPAAMPERLRVLSESTIRMFAGAAQAIRLDVTAAGDCPDPLRQLVLRVAHEFVGNAVKHGMRERVAGTVSVRLMTDMNGWTSLVVTDDGWGFDGSPDAGDGLKIASELAASVGGTISLLRTRVTVAELELPSPRVQRGLRPRNREPGFQVTRAQERGCK